MTPAFYDSKEHKGAIDAMRRAVDPYGFDGEQVTATRVSGPEALARLGQQGYVVVKRDEVATDYELERRDK